MFYLRKIHFEKIEFRPDFDLVKNTFNGRNTSFLEGGILVMYPTHVFDLFIEICDFDFFSSSGYEVFTPFVEFFQVQLSFLEITKVA